MEIGDMPRENIIPLFKNILISSVSPKDFIVALAVQNNCMLTA